MKEKRPRRRQPGPTGTPGPAGSPAPPAAPHAKPTGRFGITTRTPHAVASGSKDLGLSLPPLLHSLVVTATFCNISKCGLGALRGAAFRPSVQHPAKQVHIPEQKR